MAPSIFNVGYSWRILYYDSNLAEGLPAKDVRFVVKAGSASADPKAVPEVVNTGFEGEAGKPLSGWSVDSTAAACVSTDTEVKHSGRSSVKMTLDKLPEAARGACQVVQTVQSGAVQVLSTHDLAQDGGREGRGLERHSHVRR